MFLSVHGSFALKSSNASATENGKYLNIHIREFIKFSIAYKDIESHYDIEIYHYSFGFLKDDLWVNVNVRHYVIYRY